MNLNDLFDIQFKITNLYLKISSNCTLIEIGCEINT